MKIDINYKDNQYQNNNKYLLYKTIIWRIIASSLAFSITFFFTGHVLESGYIVLSDTILEFIFYYLYEKIWNCIIQYKTEINNETEIKI